MKMLKRTLALLIASVMCFSAIEEIPTKAATEKSTDISWYGGQNGNPWNGSDWTFLTGKDGNFTKMEQYISNDSATASIKPGWAADADANTAYIGTWRQQATQENWAVTAFDIAENGNITGTSGQTLKTSGAGSGDVMVVLKNADGFYPVWPSKGEWTWQTVADTAGISFNFTTGYKSGDTLYYIVKPSEGVDLTRITICPSLTFAGGTATDYPSKFTAFGGDVVEEAEVWENHIGWYVTQATQPWSGSYFTFEYLDLSTNEFKKLETHVADANPAYWQDETGTTIIKGWQQFASNKKYSAVTFTAGEKGVVSLTNNTIVTGKVVSGELMLVQRSGDAYAILMDWTSIPVGQSVTLPNVETYVEAGDAVYYLYRSKSRTVSVIEMTPGVNYVIGVEDREQIYPTTWTDLRTVIMGAQHQHTPDIALYENMRKAAEEGNDKIVDRVVKCSVCREELSRETIPYIRLSSGALAVENDISIIYKAKASCIDGYYTDVYIVVKQKTDSGIKETIVEGKLNGDNYEFVYKGVAAKQVGDLMDVTIYGYHHDEFVVGETLKDYGVITYIKNQLSKIDSYNEEKREAFKTLLVDLVCYGAAAQNYFNYKKDALVTDQLSEELLACASKDSVLDKMKNHQNLTYETVDNPTIKWKAAGLVLDNTTIIRVRIEYEGDVENIKVYARHNSNIYELTEYEADTHPEHPNQYFFYFDELRAAQFSDPVDFYVIEGDTVISNTLRYSVETYALKKKNNITSLGALVKAMMKYGYAANVFLSGDEKIQVNRELFYGVCYCAYEAAVWYGRDVDAELQAMEGVGAKSTRVWMRSTHMMSDPKTFKASSVATMKEIIANAQGRGIEVIGMNCNWFNGTDDDMAVPARNLEVGSDYMKFLADYEETWYQMAMKFQEIDTWEIGNEWNNDTFLHPLDYKENGTTFTASEKAAIATDMLYYASRGIHRGNPNAKTVLGGLVDVYETGYGDAKTFLEMIYANIGSGQYPSKNPDDYFQIAAWHPYNHSGTPNAAWVQRQKDIYQVILNHEGHGKVVLFTEIGLSDYGNAEKDAEQKDDVIATLTMIRDELPFVQSVHWFRMFDEANAESWGGAFETGFGLFTEPDENGYFEMKAKGEAYLEMTGGK